MTVYELEIPLTRIVACRGIYDCNNDGRKTEMPVRALWLAPAAAASFVTDLALSVTVSDMYRGPDSSLAALRAKPPRGAAAPGRSAHNYGRAIDIDLTTTMRALGLNKEALDGWLADRGWYCWRDDHALEREAWHYYWAPLGASYTRGNAVRWWNHELERAYPVRFDTKRRQRALDACGFYSGEIDGIPGPLTHRALEAFGRSWGSSVDRTLAFVEWSRANAQRLRVAG